MKELKLRAKKILVLILSAVMSVNVVGFSGLEVAAYASGSEAVQKEMQMTQTNVEEQQDGEGEDTLPELKGSLDFENEYSSLTVGVTITAIFTDGDTGEGGYYYKWYCVDGDTETVVQESTSVNCYDRSSYVIKQEDIGKQFYCEVTKTGTSGSVKSEKTSPVLGYSLDGAIITLNKSTWTYDGTEKKPTVQVTLPGNTTLSPGISFEVSYENNIHAGTAKIIITGIGPYSGSTTETTFTIERKKEFDDLKIEGVEDTYEYTGEEICPKIVVKDGDEVIPESQYIVSYKDNVNPGTAVVTITGTDDGDYDFSEANNDKNFTIVHDHDWKYAVDNGTILMECTKDACTCQNKRAMLGLWVENADNLVYSGGTQDVATVTQSPQDVLPEGAIKKTYIGDGLENGLPKNVGSYKVTMSVEDGGETYTATLDFEIRKAKPDIGTVTADVLNDTLDVNQVKLSRTDTTIPGTLRLQDVTKLKYGTYDYSWVFEPEDSANYETIDGTVSITVADTVAPRASYTIGEGYSQEFRDTISYGYLCKNTETMEITFKDNLSGVAEKQYYIADSEITDFEGVAWTDYTGPIVLPLGRNRIVYVRVTDNAGNIAILNSDGLIVYQESVLDSNELSYIYHESKIREIHVNENGNSFVDLVDDSEHALDQKYYSVYSENGNMMLTLYSNYLDTLSVGTHTYKIKMYPQGVHEYETIAYSFSIKVEKAELYVVDVQATDRTYNGSSLVDITEVTLGRVDGWFMASSAEVSVDINGLQGTLEKADAGTYKNVSLPELTLTGTDVDSYVLVQPDSPVYVLHSVTISKKPAPVIQTVQKSYVYTKDIKEEINLKELLPADCGEAVFGNPNDGSGGYEHYKTAPAVNGSILSYTAGKTTWEQLQADNGGELVIPVQMTNYEDTEIKLILSLRDQTNVKLKAGTEVQLKNNVLTYGEPLSKLTFEEAVFTDEAGNVIEGRLDWMDGSIQPHAGNSVGTWQFTPADAEYKTVEGTVDIVVNPTKPEIKAPAVEERIYHPTKALEDSDLTGIVANGIDGTALAGTWSWKNAGIVPMVGNSGYEAVFTPADTQNYTAVSVTVEVKVKKAVPAIVQNPVATEIAYGESLANSVLNGGSAQHSISKTAISGKFAWKDATIKPNVADSNQTAYTLVFTPDDTANYDITETTVTLNIKRVGNAPNLPANRMSVVYNCKTVKDITLPEGWKWADADQETNLAVGTPVQATAVYIGEGHGNYETESIVIEITRLADTNKEDEGGSSSSATSEDTTTTDGNQNPPASKPASGTTSEATSEPASEPAPAISEQDKNENNTKAPFIKGEDGKEGWEVIQTQVKEAAEGETIQVDMNGTTVVPGDIFDSIKGSDVTITFDLGDGILWTVNGLDVTAQNAKDIDFGVTMGEQAGENIPVDVINNVTGERYSINLTLAYDGEFGFNATLTINMDAANAGLYANLFYYNPASGELEFMCAGKIDEAGNTELTFSHASDYTIVIDTQPMNQTAVDAGISKDHSGNGLLWILIGTLAVVLIAIGTGYVLYRRRGNPQQ